MKNPWTKKNPFMSMWLSGANKVAGAARAQASATLKREVSRASKTAAADASKQVLDFWAAPFGAPVKGRRKKTR